MLLAGGCVLGEVLALLDVVVGVGVLLFSITAVLWLCLLKGRSRVLMLLPVFMAMGYVRMDNQTVSSAARLELHLDGRFVQAEGTVKSITQKDGAFTITTGSNRVAYGETIASLPMLSIYIDDASGLVSDIKPGQRISVSGGMKQFSEPRNPGEFHAALYYRSLKLDYRLFGEEVQIIDQGSSPYLQALRYLNEHCGRVLTDIAESDDLGIFRAAILGDKSSLDVGVRDLYQKNGIAHLLAISGLHVSIVGMGVYFVLRKAGLLYGWSGILAGILMVSYGIMTGSSSSVVRAVIMLLCSFLAAYLGRTYDLLSAACVAGILLILDSPYLLFQGGVQLSFGAVLSIGLLGHWMIRVIKPSHGWQNTCLVSLSIQIVTYPMILYHFFQFPSYSIVLNVLVIPLMAYVICSGILGIVLGSVCLDAGIAAIGTGHYILRWYQWLCVRASRLPGYTLILGRPDSLNICAYYMCLLISCICIGKIKRVRYRLMGILAMTAVCFVLLLPVPPSNLEITFLDVGQGDGIFIQEGETNILVDGGSTSVKELGKYRLEPYLKSQGVSQIHYAFVSHADQDHISGLTYLLENGEDIHIQRLYLSCLSQGDEAYEPLKEAVRKRGGQVYQLSKGDTITLKTLQIQCLYPGKDHVAADRNEQSQVLRFDYGQFHMLLTGDMSETSEINMLASLPENVQLSEIQVLKAAHHGSNTSTCEAFLDAVNPQWVILSYGEDNSYGHPHQVVTERLSKRNIKMWRTAHSGAIKLVTDGVRIWWDPYLTGSTAVVDEDEDNPYNK